MPESVEALPVRQSRLIAASPETVWEFLVDPMKVIRWMGVNAELDPRPGGVYRVEVLPGSFASGSFVALDPPRRLVFTWGWEAGSLRSLTPGSTKVEIDLEPHQDGTLLRLTHSGLPAAEQVSGHGRGWAHYLGRLGEAASGAAASPDPWIATPPEFINERK